MKIETLIEKQTKVFTELGALKSVIMSKIVMTAAKEFGWNQEQLIQFLEMYLEQGKLSIELKKQHNN